MRKDGDCMHYYGCIDHRFSVVFIMQHTLHLYFAILLSVFHNMEDSQMKWTEATVVQIPLPAALRSIESVGLDELSRPRFVHKKYVKPLKGYLPDGTKIPPIVSPAALVYKPSQNIEKLAKPLRRFANKSPAPHTFGLLK